MASAIKKFLQHEAAGGVILFFTAVAAIIFENAGFKDIYEAIQHFPLPFPGHQLSFVHFVNDALMAVFFLIVGMEIKREILQGELSTRPQLMMPLIAACGGMLFPALIFFYFNSHDPSALRGWAIPAATDIAFAIGVISLFGRRLPLSLKVFLTALAILDDLGAIAIIAFFYSSSLQWGYLAGAATLGAVLFLFNRRGVQHLAVYMLFGLLLWYCVFSSGVHATLAGVGLAFAIPLRVVGKSGISPLARLTEVLHPPVTFFILPLFSFLNAGVSLQGLTLEALLAPIPLGIGAGLFFGKQIGVFLFSLAAISLGWGKRPSGSSWGQFYGICIVTGIGFTMSLFIGGLAYSDMERAAYVRLGVILGSLLSTVLGATVLHFTLPRRSGE